MGTWAWLVGVQARIAPATASAAAVLNHLLDSRMVALPCSRRGLTLRGLLLDSSCSYLSPIIGIVPCVRIHRKFSQQQSGTILVARSLQSVPKSKTSPQDRASCRVPLANIERSTRRRDFPLRRRSFLLCRSNGPPAVCPTRWRGCPSGPLAGRRACGRSAVSCAVSSDLDERQPCST